jgi:hypothetical protein
MNFLEVSMKQRVEYKKSYFWLGPLALLTLGSCGEYVGSLQSISADKQEATSTQKFTAELRALNPSLLPSEGEAKMKLGEGSLEVEINMRSVSESSHRQTLIRGNCPDSSADTNEDGVIDGSEYQIGDSAVWELDDDLADTASESVYPVGDASGQYHYSESLAQMEEAVTTPDLRSGEYSIVIFGIDDENELPETVSGERDMIPMACGKLQKEEMSEEPQDDEGQEPQDQGQDQVQDQGQQSQQQQQQQQQGQHSQQSQQGQGQQNVTIPEDDSDLETIIIE